MTEASRDKDASAELEKSGPDYFGYYTREVAYLLSRTEDCLPYASQTLDLAERTGGVISQVGFTKHIYTGKEGSCSGAGALFCDVVGAGISDFKKERLNALLRQSVRLLTQELVEMEEPVIALHRIQRFKEKVSTSPSANCEDTGENPHKKLKLCSPSIRSTSPTSCNHNLEVNDDLQLLIKTESAKVEETMRKISDELSETLERKKQKLEHLLDIIMSDCRPMTLVERQQLRNLISKLSPEYLNRVVELIQRCGPSANSTSDEIFVDLENLDNTTLWRLYYYVKTLENARKVENCPL